MNKKQLITLFFHLFLFNSLFSHAFATSAERLEKINQELLKVKASLSTIQEPKLVLGVKCNEANLERFSNDYIFLDLVQNSENNRALSVNFNDLDELKLVASFLKDIFIMIVLDDSTYKFTNWSREHLAYFKEMLRPQGQFIFGPSLECTSISFNQVAISYEESLKNLKKWLKSQSTLVHSFEVPYLLTAGSRNFSLEVQKRLEIYEAFQNRSMEEWDDLMTELSIDWMPSDSLLKKSVEEICVHVSREVIQDELRRDFYDNYILPDNTIEITSEVFNGEVLLEYNKSLPFTSNYNPKLKYIIRAFKN